MRTLKFGRGPLQGAVDPTDPVAMALPYTRYLPIGLAFVNNLRKVLMIGLGAGSFPRLLRAGYPELEIDVVEIDPDVVALSKQHFFVQEDSGYRIWISDGRSFIRERKKEYDIVVLDAFCEGSVPVHLTTLEFLREVKAAIAEGGVVLSNIIRWKTAVFKSMLKTFQTVFGPMVLFRVRGRSNVVVVASVDGRLQSKEALKEAVEKLQDRIHPSVDLRDVIEAYSDPPADLEDSPILRDEDRGVD